MSQWAKVEIIVIQNKKLNKQEQRELEKWLKTTLQVSINRQQYTAEKKFLELWSHTPAIYMS